MGQIRAILCGYYGKGNGGDEALLASLLEMLPKNVKPIVLSGNPRETKRFYGVESCDRMSFLSLLQALRRCDVFIWGGGSLMQDATSPVSAIYYGGLMGLAQGFGLKTIAWAQGIGPLKRPLTQRITKQAFANCTAVSVRDRASADLLSSWQIPGFLAPDPVWALTAKSVSGAWDVSIPRVAVTLRSHPQLTPQRLAILTNALIEFQSVTKTCILLIPFQASQDLAIAESIQPKLPGPVHIVSLSDPRELKGVFRGVSMAIGMRLHSLIMAAAEECRCFALSYDPKVTELMAEINIPGWKLEEIPDDANLIARNWIDYYNNGKGLSKDKINFWRDRALMHQELLKEVCQSNL